jgi:hypothetical protein
MWQFLLHATQFVVAPSSAYLVRSVKALPMFGPNDRMPPRQARLVVGLFRRGDIKLKGFRT